MKQPDRPNNFLINQNKDSTNKIESSDDQFYTSSESKDFSKSN